MADWVHCNLCCRQLSGEVKFYLGTCSHIFCDLCKNKGSDSQCALCHNPCKVKELNDELDQHLRAYFMVPETQIKRQIEVMKFQAYHRSILLKQMRRKLEGQSRVMKQAEERFRNLKQENIDLKMRLQGVEEVNMQLRQDNSLLKKYIHSYKTYDSDGLSQKPVTPLQLVHSPMVMSPLTRASRAVHSPITPIILPQLGSGAPGCLEEIQNTPRTSRMSVRQPPSKGRMGTPTQQSLKPTYPNQIASPIVGLYGSPGNPSRVQSNSRANSPFVLRSPQLTSHTTNRINMCTENVAQNLIKYASSSQVAMKRNCPSLHEVYKTPFNNLSDSVTTVKTPNVSSKYFARVDQIPPHTPATKRKPPPR